MPVCASSGTDVPRDTHLCDAAVLVRHHLAGFLERIEEGSHAPLPGFVQGERRGFELDDERLDERLNRYDFNWRARERDQYLREHDHRSVSVR